MDLVGCEVVCARLPPNYPTLKLRGAQHEINRLLSYSVGYLLGDRLAS